MRPAASSSPPRILLHGIVLAQGHAHVGADRLGGGQGQRCLAHPRGSGQARDAYRHRERPWADEHRRRHVVRSSAAGRSFHGEEAARVAARREPLDEAALDAVEAGVRAVQHLPQMGRVEPGRRPRPPRQRHGHHRPFQRSRQRHLPRRRRRPEGAPQLRLDCGREHAAFEGREHPLDARPGRGERAHGRELIGRRAFPRRGHGPGLGGPLDRGPGPRRGIAEHLERPRLVHQACTGRQVGQAPPVPSLLGGDHVAAGLRPVPRPVGIRAAALGHRAARAAERLQRLPVLVERRRVDEQHLPGAVAPQNLHTHRYFLRDFVRAARTRPVRSCRRQRSWASCAPEWEEPARTDSRAPPAIRSRASPRPAAAA